MQVQHHLLQVFGLFIILLSFKQHPVFFLVEYLDSLSRTLEGNFGAVCAIFFPRPLPGLGGISNFPLILKRKKLPKLLCSQLSTTV